ncbi:MAG: 4-hydroxybenzoyl-CoA thioesterase [Hydrocarboniphaga sp.]|uniref:acyl-CoA thioesterase n=1 Tax=Hydrocarboniphaga sp. TaxID=2033016 RepID=UPI002634C96B|nr:thioesterase family protein [Hydrocarboniphaga sp.]MDB5969862.1 4-hydroxybenzoyl-CoA thioesterase [Hydrocarboniphaga sp.]
MEAAERSVEIQIKVPFHDVDSAGMVWHGHYAKYFEVARCELLESFGYSYMAMIESGYTWPVIDMHLRYVRPATFGQQIAVRATLKEWEHRLRIGYLIRDANTGERMTKGDTVQVAVDLKNMEMQLASPRVLLERLGIAK